jgi:hypothetical protein
MRGATGGNLQLSKPQENAQAVFDLLQSKR